MFDLMHIQTYNAYKFMQNAYLCIFENEYLCIFGFANFSILFTYLKLCMFFFFQICYIFVCIFQYCDCGVTYRNKAVKRLANTRGKLFLINFDNRWTGFCPLDFFSNARFQLGISSSRKVGPPSPSQA